MSDWSVLQDIIGVSFNNISLLERALVHSSYLNENPGSAAGSNERLEFLGDAVLGLIMAEKLYRDFPELAEGEMTKLRAVVVRRETLARCAESIKLGDFLCLGKGEEASGGRRKPVNLAGAMEALIAAIYLDQGYESVRQFVPGVLHEEITRVLERSAAVDYKSRLQELVQSKQRLIPVYHTVSATGPDHDRWFTVEVKVGDSVLGKGSGRSKKEAEGEAARAALERLSG